MTWRFTLEDTTFGSTITQIVTEPQGWQGSKFIFRRDLKWHGVFFDYTLNDLVFYGDGYTIIKDAYEAKGILATTDLTIGIECEEGAGYDTFFEGKLNYAQIKFIQGDVCGVSIGIQQTGCLQEFIARYDQKVNLEALESYGGETLQPYVGLGELADMSLKDILFTTELSNPEDYSFTPTDAPVTGLSYNYFGQFLWEVGKDEITETVAVNLNSFAPSSYSAVDYRRDNSALIEFIQSDVQCAGSITINLSLQGSLSEVSNDARSYTGILNFVHSAADGTIKTIQTLDNTLGGIFGALVTNNKTFNVSHSDTILNLENGDKFFIYLQLASYLYTTGGGGGTSDPFDLTVDFTSGTFSATIDSLCGESEAKVFLINEALSRTVEIITDDCMRVYSEYYGRTDSEPYDTDDDGCGSNKFITNGLMLRNATLTDGSDPVCSVSFKDLFDGLNPIDNIGIGIETDPERAAGFYRIRVEDVEFFYNATLAAICTDVKDVTIALDDKRIFSNIEVGYKKWESEYTGGRDDFHSKRIYRTEQSAISNTLNIQSEFIASNYSLEITRRQGGNTNDWKYDNNIFICCFARNVYGQIAVDDDFFPSTGTNLLALIYFNQRISPVRNLLHWFKTIAATWNYEFLTQIKQLIFTSGEGNYIAEWRKTANDDCLLEDQSSLLSESQNIDKTTFKDYDDCKPIWAPETIEYDYPMSYQQFRSIRLAPYGLVRVTQGANTWNGWIESIEYDPNEGMAKWKLIRQYEDNY